MKSQNSPQRSALENLVAENDRMRDNIAQLKKEREELIRNLRKAEAEAKSHQLKAKTLENQRQRNLADNRRFMESLENEKRQRVKLLTELAQAKNAVMRKEHEFNSMRSQTNDLQNQNERLRKQIQTASLQQIQAIKDKQTVVNSVKILETKLEAAEAEKKFQATRASQLQIQLNRVKDQLSGLLKKYRQRQVVVQEIYRDEESTKQKLLQQFQNKISDKDQEMRRQIQKYLNQNSALKQKVIELKGSLH